jgi:hypothetical protein
LVGTISFSEEKDNLGQIKSTNNVLANYQYDADGFVIKGTSESEFSEASEVVIKANYNADYEYQNGRLTKVNTESLIGPSAYAYTSLYEYDVVGKLIKYTYVTTLGDYSSSNIYDFNNNKVTMIGFTGAQTEGELDADGYLIKEVNLAGIERRYLFDDDGDLIRGEEWRDGEMIHASVYTYDDKKSPNILSSATSLKGSPDLKIYSAISPIHNYLKETHFDIGESGEEIISSSKTYIIQYNASGYPTGITASESNER